MASLAYWDGELASDSVIRVFVLGLCKDKERVPRNRIKPESEVIIINL